MSKEPRLQDFEGLVIATARIYAGRLRYEEDDLEQELRVKVWQAMRSYSPTRSPLPIQRYVFTCLTNRIKDMKRDAAREVARRERFGVSFLHIEDCPVGHDENGRPMGTSASAFESLFMCVERDEVYGQIDCGKFVLPSTLTDVEARVLVLLMLVWSRPEISRRLGISIYELNSVLRRLRIKLADWNPGECATAVAIDDRIAVAA